MTNVQELEGDDLENWFKDLFKNKFKLEDYYTQSRQIGLRELDPNARSGQHLEIDGVLLLKRTAILLEFTAEQSRISNKIKKFTRSCHLFTTSSKTLREKFALFDSIPEAKLSDFDEVNDLRFAFFGTSPEIDDKKLEPSHFPDYPDVKNKLTIFGNQHIEYFSELTELINQYAKYEFLSALDFSPSDLGENQRIEKNFIKVENRYVTESNDIKADIYLVSFKLKELLKIGRVSRYEGIPFALEEKEKAQYQRFLVKHKLSDIARKFIDNDKRKTFPNTVTLVLSTECETDPQDSNTLLIPNRYSSIDIIDGQHRIFAYANEEIDNEVLENAEILASAIKFQTDDQTEIIRQAAKIFCEINSKQAIVKNSLLYLIKYDVLGDIDALALAGKAILECNKGNSALGNVFLINSLIKKNKFNLPAIPITTIVEQDLCKFFDGKGIDDELEDTDFTNIFEHDKNYLKNNPDQWWRNGQAVLEQYFNHIKDAFPNDWEEDAESNLLSAKYITAFIRLLRNYMIDQSKSMVQVQRKLTTAKNKVNRLTRPRANQASFPKNDERIPSTRYGINKIYDFLNNPRRDWL